MQKPFSWIRNISEHIAELDAVPLFGNAPALDWDKLSEQLASRFETAGLKIGEKKQAWKTADELKEGLGESCLVTPIRLSPLNGHAFWLMPREHVSKLTGWMLGGQPLTSEILAEGFYRFLLLQTLDAASGLAPFNGLTLGLAEEASLPETDALCVDIQLSLEKRSCWGRLVIPPELQKNWCAHFASNTVSLLQNAPGLELSLSVQMGTFSLTKREWQSFKKGDVAPLRRGDTHHAALMLGTLPLFQAKIKQHKLHLLEDPFTHEETMEKHPENVDEPKPVSLKELPLNITIELAQLKMTLEKLLQLEPGNVIDVPIDTNQPVRLTVNGQLIGHGELVHVGEALAIRLLDKG